MSGSAPAPPIKVPRLPEATVVIAGGTSGVGLASARRFLAAGVPRLVVLGRGRARGERAVQELREARPDARIMFLACDVGVPAEVSETMAEIVSELGTVDVAVCSTTYSATPELLHDIPLQDMAEILTAQALPPMLLTRAVLPVMRAQRGGVILNIASDAAKTATPGETVLGAAMAAIVMFSRTAAMEAKRDGVRVNALTPSLILGTETGERSLAGGFSAKLFGRALQAAHLGATEPDDLAALIVWLAGPEAARLTGQAISVNGGISAA